VLAIRSGNAISKPNVRQFTLKSARLGEADINASLLKRKS
jgi:hypothetical protein